MAKDHILQNCIRHPHQHWHKLVHLGTIVAHTNRLTALIRTFQDLLHLFEFLFVLAVEQLVGTHGKDRLSTYRVELQLESCLGFCLIRDAWVMYESLSSHRVRRHGSRRHSSETLDDCGLAGAVLSKNQCEWFLELNFLFVIRIKGANAS